MLVISDCTGGLCLQWQACPLSLIESPHGSVWSTFLMSPLHAMKVCASWCGVFRSRRTRLDDSGYLHASAWTEDNDEHLILNVFTQSEFGPCNGDSIAGARRRRNVATFVAITATFTAIIVSTVVVISRGGTAIEKAASVLAGSIVLLLGVHLLPEMSRPPGGFLGRAALLLACFDWLRQHTATLPSFFSLRITQDNSVRRQSKVLAAHGCPSCRFKIRRKLPVTKR